MTSDELLTVLRDGGWHALALEQRATFIETQQKIAAAERAAREQAKRERKPTAKDKGK